MKTGCFVPAALAAIARRAEHRFRIFGRSRVAAMTCALRTRAKRRARTALLTVKKFTSMATALVFVSGGHKTLRTTAMVGAKFSTTFTQASRSNLAVEAAIGRHQL